MNKKEFLSILLSELKRMEEDHISEEAEKGNYERVDEIVEKVDYDFLSEYMLDGEFELIRVTEIPEQYRSTFAFFIYGARNIRVPDFEDDLDLYLIYNIEELIDWLSSKGGVSKIIGKTLESTSMSEYVDFSELIDDYNG